MNEVLQALREGEKHTPLSDDEIKAFEEVTGVDVHDVKGKGKGKDLFKDESGEILVKPKSGQGPGEPTGYNINAIMKRRGRR